MFFRVVFIVLYGIFFKIKNTCFLEFGNWGRSRWIFVVDLYFEGNVGLKFREFVFCK